MCLILLIVSYCLIVFAICASKRNLLLDMAKIPKKTLQLKFLLRWLVS